VICVNTKIKNNKRGGRLKRSNRILALELAVEEIKTRLNMIEFILNDKVKKKPDKICKKTINNTDQYQVEHGILEWIAELAHPMTWHATQEWVKTLNMDNGQVWRLPSLAELRQLQEYDIELFKKIKNIGGRVWSTKATKDIAHVFNFYIDETDCYDMDEKRVVFGFAVKE
jgi:hypothetical protein